MTGLHGQVLGVQGPAFAAARVHLAEILSHLRMRRVEHTTDSCVRSWSIAVPIAVPIRVPIRVTDAPNTGDWE